MTRDVSISVTATRGAGLYGGEPRREGHRCGRCANPYTVSQGSAECPNNPDRTKQFSGHCDWDACRGHCKTDCICKTVCDAVIDDLIRQERES